jgi:hypothetical protein
MQLINFKINIYIILYLKAVKNKTDWLGIFFCPSNRLK